MNSGYPPQHLRSWLASWAAIALSAATLVGGTQITLRVLNEEPTRARDLDVFRLCRLLPETLHLALPATLPPFAYHVRTVAEWTDGARFVGEAGVLLCLVFGGFAMVICLSTLIARCIVSRWRFPRVPEWLWRRAFLAMTFGFLVAPVSYSAFGSFVEGMRCRAPLVAAFALAASAVLIWLSKGPKWSLFLAVARFLGLFGLLASTVAALVGHLASSAFETRAPEPAPNVLLISVDSLRPDHLGCYGYGRETSPAIDRLAAEGVRFETVVSSSSWTLPAHVSLLSSLPCEAHGVVKGDLKARQGIVFLAEVLREAGYTTAGFVAGPYLSADFGFLQGFEHYDDYTVASVVPRPPFDEVTSPVSVSLVEDWVRAWRRGRNRRPFFVFLHLWDVHYDYVPPPPYDTMFDARYTGTITGRGFESNEGIHMGMAQRDLDHIIALYDGEIRYTDVHVRRLFETLQSLGAFDTTVIVLTADHGEEFFEHGNKGHRQTLFDETILVPLVIRYPPKVRRGVVVSDQVSILDIAPTILSLAGINRPHGFGTSPSGLVAGESLLPAIAGRSRPSSSSLARSDLHGVLKSVRSTQDKMIWDGRNDRLVYFDLILDPMERSGIFDPETERAESLRSQLAESVVDWTTTEPLVEHGQLEEQVVERLQALGYVE